MKKRFRYLLLTTALLVSVSSCEFRPEPEPLQYSVLSTLNLLQENSQFAMYLNFKSMRRTEFWQNHISDSLLNAEKTFGSILNTFKISTGAAISDGLDELYYSNSWFGENAIVLKGLFDKARLDTLLAHDSTYSLSRTGTGPDIYVNNENGLYFFFKDDFTICASNYLKQIDQMISVDDTSRSGLLRNEQLLSAIQSAVYKENLWMVTSERMFIRGMFMNMIESTSGKRVVEEDTLQSDSAAVVDRELSIRNLYKAVRSLTFSAMMDKELKLLVQGECVSENASKLLMKTLSGLLTVAKFSGKEKQDPAASQILKSVELRRYDESVFVNVRIDDRNIGVFKSNELMGNPAGD